MRGGWVYIMADRYRGATYIGVTADLAARVYAHRHGRGSAHVRKYCLLRLVHAEPYETIDEAIAREKAVKKWNRAWKIRLIEEGNPDWLDLYEHVIGA
ncbi:MAG TPA: GIY-YIG nuclease family protein [Allosphingosinicella sp.]|jgi:putative endonuclease|uniref:GIY-YIG nuclease family protein n=1 Tax=Allosphingosinicella sp. TaxID=2823234 RepID=UPI002F275B86